MKYKDNVKEHVDCGPRNVPANHRVFSAVVEHIENICRRGAQGMLTFVTDALPQAIYKVV